MALHVLPVALVVGRLPSLDLNFVLQLTKEHSCLFVVKIFGSTKEKNIKRKKSLLRIPFKDPCTFWSLSPPPPSFLSFLVSSPCLQELVFALSIHDCRHLPKWAQPPSPSCYTGTRNNPGSRPNFLERSLAPEALGVRAGATGEEVF